VLEMKNKTILVGTAIAVILMLTMAGISNTQAKLEMQTKTNSINEKNSEFHVLSIDVRSSEDEPSRVFCTVQVNGRGHVNQLLWLLGKTWCMKIVNTNEVKIEISDIYNQSIFCPYFSEEFDLSGHGTFIRFLAITSEKTIKIIE
jgi:hypothetical protein